MESHEHSQQARFLLNSLNHPLVAGNSQLLSEVLWGTATQMLKAVARTLNIPCGTHRELFRAARDIGANVTSDPDLIREFGRVGQLHENFYEGDMSDTEIAVRHTVALRIVAKMQRILDAR